MMHTGGSAASALLFAMVLLHSSHQSQSLELVATEISWRACIAGVADPLFPAVCSGASSPLAVAVTITATWWQVTTGPAVLSKDGSSVILSAASVPMLVRRIGWQYPSNTSSASVLQMNDPSGYLFRITGAPNTVDNTVSSRLTFQLTFPATGDYEVFFEGCCRYSGLANQPSSPASAVIVPWRLQSSLRVSDQVRAAVARVSPRIVTGGVMQLLQSSGMSFLLTAADGGPLVSLLDPTPISGLYVEAPGNYYVDRTATLRRGGGAAAGACGAAGGCGRRSYVRADGNFSVVWFDSPSESPQLLPSRAWAAGRGWAVVRGNVSRPGLEGRPPPAPPGRPVLDSLGGLWPAPADGGAGDQYGGWRDAGPSFLAGAAALYSNGTAAAVRYEGAIAPAAWWGQDALTPPYLPAGAAGGWGPLAFRLGRAEDMGGRYTRVLPGMYGPGRFSTPEDLGFGIDRDTGVIWAGFTPTLPGLTMPPQGLYAINIIVSAADPTGATIEVAAEFWVQVGPALPRIYPSATWSVAQASASIIRVTSPSNPLVVTCGNSPTTVRIAFALPAGAAAQLVGPLSVSYLNASAAPIWNFDQSPTAVGGAAAGVYALNGRISARCGVASVRGAAAACFEAAANVSGVVRKARSLNCLYIRVDDASATTPPIQNTTLPPPVQTTTPAPPPSTPRPITPPPAQPGPNNDPPQDQIKRGFLDLQYEGDMSILSESASGFGAMPTLYALSLILKANPSLNVLCAGSRDGNLQGQITAIWNKNHNSVDDRLVWSSSGTPPRTLGPLDIGERATADGQDYTWGCAYALRYQLSAAAPRELIPNGPGPVAPTESVSYACRPCWRRDPPPP